MLSESVYFSASLLPGLKDFESALTLAPVIRGAASSFFGSYFANAACNPIKTVITKIPVRFFNVTKQLAIFLDIFAPIGEFEFLNADAHASIVRFDRLRLGEGHPEGYYTLIIHQPSAPLLTRPWCSGWGAAADLANSQSLGMAVP